MGEIIDYGLLGDPSSSYLDRSGAGNFISLKINDDIMDYYHLDSINPELLNRIKTAKKGERIILDTPTVIGNSGNSGGNYGNHLHFQVARPK
jgi:murein DD-endopeptidase MepM/ murein hydrolase activator NlpD